MDGSADTIFALASGSAPSSVAVVRLSGPHAIAAAEAICDGEIPAARRAGLTRLIDASGVEIDHALVLVMPAPRSYTGEDVVELHVHGGSAVIDHLLDDLSARRGLRMARAGEFTRRAFENHKLDLTQVEAVADLIEAESQAQKAQALRQLDGALSGAYEAWRAEITEIVALLEVVIDFPDEGDVPRETSDDVVRALDHLISEFKRALGPSGAGERIREGFRVAIIGPPNAGKSTLLNRLSGHNAAIVTDQPGTTRDVVQTRLRIGGGVVWLMDTAGLRDTADPIEAEGVRRASAAAAAADIRLHLVDVVVGPDDSLIAQHWRDGDFYVFNKVDVRRRPPSPKAAYSISAASGDGVDELLTALERWIGRALAGAETAAVTRARHRQTLESGLERLEAARNGLANGQASELVAEDLRLASRALDALIGRVDVEDVLDQVFAGFCIGK